ncbi:13032_t:CDS:2, partial [Racocetra fulgida]
MSSFIPSTEEFKLLEELIEILFPFDEATQFLNPSEIGMCCSFLDPRFKKLNFCTGALRHTTIQNMRRQFNELCPTPTTDVNTTNTNDNNLTSTSLHQ